MKKLLLFGSILFFSLFLIVIFQKFRFDDGKTHLIFCNVGQGDGILIRTPKGLDIISDAGPDDSILSCLSRHTPFWDRDIELMLLSHPHADHMTGMVSLLKNYKVTFFGEEGLRNTTFTYNKITELVKEKNVKSKVLFAGDTFNTEDGLRLKILGPTKEFISRTEDGIIKESTEDASLVTLISYGEFDAILTGDSPLEEIEQILNESTLPKIEVFQIPHHGSRFNINENSLARIFPRLGVISVGKNSYGHPAKEVIEILRNLDIKFLRTDEHGDIEIIVEKNGQFKVR